ncbi:hypothetical protein B0H11DRAFT_1747662 [Mycena galericulata]|nr:hypothetical protein B0H11DRAFT_1747662 [Mycena galericulata]
MGIEQLRKRLTDSEMKSAHVAHDLNKEISELEALIEPSWQIYREDELEQELERTKDKLRQRKSSKGSSEVVDAQRRSGSVAGSDVSDTEGVREICEKPGHDIFSCSLLSAGSLPVSCFDSFRFFLFCEDRESHGHVAADCPHSLENPSMQFDIWIPLEL